MLYLAIPAHNEAATIGVLLWRLRTVLAEFPREYEAVVYDDASSDSTSEILEGYARVMPLTIIRGEKPLGYAGAVNALVRYVARQTRYPRRDAMLLLQGDFTDPPAMVPEFVKRFEGGADLVIGERSATALKDAPIPVKRLQLATGWMLRLLVKAEGVRDVTSSYRLIRISVLRDLLRNVGEAPVCSGDSQSANADFLLQLIPLARRVETLAVEPTWGVRLRDTRLVAMRDGVALARWAWRARGRKAVASTAPADTPSEAPRATRPGRERDRDRDNSNVLPFESVDSPRAARAAAPATSNGTQTRKPRPPRADPVVDEAVAEVVSPLSSARTKPPRRKRSRGGRKESLAAESATAADVEEVSSHQRDTESDSPPEIQRIIGIESDTDIANASDTPQMSPALSEAAEAAEDSFDAELTSARPPRKRRRRRGSRKGARSIEGDAETEGQLDADASESDSPYATDDQAASPEVRPPRPPTRARSTEVDVSSDSEGESESDGDLGESVEGESRPRRRGRRGRRGGSRRNRANRGDDAQEGAGSPDEGDRPSVDERFDPGPSASTTDGE